MNDISSDSAVCQKVISTESRPREQNKFEILDFLFSSFLFSSRVSVLKRSHSTSLFFQNLEASPWMRRIPSNMFLHC
jgi:hypothetical protein